MIIHIHLHDFYDHNEIPVHNLSLDQAEEIKAYPDNTFQAAKYRVLNAHEEEKGCVWVLLNTTTNVALVFDGINSYDIEDITSFDDFENWWLSSLNDAIMEYKRSEIFE